jgi:hypothetical protein
MTIEAIADLAKEPELEKAAEQPKVLVIVLLKLSATTTTTLRKRRMTSVLDVVFRVCENATSYFCQSFRWENGRCQRSGYCKHLFCSR